jgi:hypothetical protein
MRHTLRLFVLAVIVAAAAIAIAAPFAFSAPPGGYHCNNGTNEPLAGGGFHPGCDPGNSGGHDSGIGDR